MLIKKIPCFVHSDPKNFSLLLRSQKWNITMTVNKLLVDLLQAALHLTALLLVQIHKFHIFRQKMRKLDFWHRHTSSEFGFRPVQVTLSNTDTVCTHDLPSNIKQRRIKMRFYSGLRGSGGSGWHLWLQQEWDLSFGWLHVQYGNPHSKTMVPFPKPQHNLNLYVPPLNLLFILF